MYKRGADKVKATGILRKVDELGRVVIPIELRRNLDIEEQDSMEIFVDGNKVILQKYQPGCTNCGDLEVVVSVGKTRLCRACYEGLRVER